MRSSSIHGQPAQFTLLPAALLFAAVMFNAVLAIVNAHVTGMSPAVVIAAEVLIVAAAHLVALAAFRREMMPWYALLLIMTVLALTRSLGTGEIDIKPLRDVLLIPTFLILGMTFDRRHLNKVVVAIHAVVLAVLVLEAISVDAYSALFKVQDYYISTRGYEQENFWNKESELYVSATRPDARFFSFVDLHRLSSVFLEPVSLGNYCIIIAAFVAARYASLTRAVRWFLIVGTGAMLIGCDGRLAAMSCIAIALVAVIAPKLPRYTPVVYLPAVTALAFLLAALANLKGGADDFPGRIAHTVDLIKMYDLQEWLGVSQRYLTLAVDSGLAYLITTQSIFGVLIIWLFIVFAARERTPEQIRFTHGLCIYLALTMMVSFSLLTIKTAALLWFIQGALQAGQVGLATHSPARSRPQRRVGALATRSVPALQPAPAR